MPYLPPKILHTRAYATNGKQKERVRMGASAVFTTQRTRREQVKAEEKASQKTSETNAPAQRAALGPKPAPLRNTRHDQDPTNHQDQTEDARKVRAKVKEKRDHLARVQESKNAKRGIMDNASTKTSASMVTHRHASNGHPQRDAAEEPIAGSATSKLKEPRLQLPVILRNRRIKRTRSKRRRNPSLQSDRIAKEVKAAKAAAPRRNHEASDAQHRELESSKAMGA